MMAQALAVGKSIHQICVLTQQVTDTLPNISGIASAGAILASLGPVGVSLIAGATLITFLAVLPTLMEELAVWIARVRLAADHLTEACKSDLDKLEELIAEVRRTL